MPVTKKKGAIFAIYTDSPARSTRSQVTNASPSTVALISTTSIPSKSPTRKSVATRKALTTVQPKSLGFPSDPLPKVDKGKARAVSHHPIKGSENPSVPSVNPKSQTKSTTTATSAKRTGAAGPKRQFEIFRAVSPSAPISPTTSTHPCRVVESPIKKTRSTPRRPAPHVENDENLPPVDSPASRTRSKVRAGLSSTGISSPIQALRLTSNTSRKGIESLVGDGKGTFTLKKGRAVAQLMRDGDIAVGDVLGDVSEAYGAEGSAPLGFENQRR